MLVYLDSCVLLAAINGEHDRVGTVEAILLEGRSRKHRLFTSTLTIAEVAHGTAADDTQHRIDALWQPSSPINAVNVTAAIGHRARELMQQARTDGISVKPADAIHLATADLYDCDRLFTYDGQHSQWDQLIEADVSEPFTNEPTLGLSASHG